jgi:murein DD-endopeptidase MepM/ murein hydrolase activator NlpD
MTEAARQALSKPRRGIRRIVIASASAVALTLLCVCGVTLWFLGGLVKDAPQYALGCGNGEGVDPNAPLPRVLGLIEQQVRNAAIIISVGQEMRVPPRGWVIAVATAMQESRLTNLPHLGSRNDHDSIGLFQQRPSQGWGTPEQLADPAYQSRKFFEKLLRLPGWENLPLTVAAQRVQVSAYPSAYAKHEPLASRIVDALTGGASRAVGNALALRCAAAGEIAASGWTVPLRGPLTSAFRTPARPAHNGVDIAVPKGTAIHAASAGYVLVATCNAHVGFVPYSCNRDGGTWVRGCGWYVDILHAADVITRYCHMQARPLVRPGQRVGAGAVIGFSGSSGNSSGPHLHFEVHLNGNSSGSGAVDPVTFMGRAGATLGGSAQ